MKNIILSVLITLSLFGSACSSKKKILYVTHEPENSHAYTPQLAIFKEIGEKAGWDVSVWTGEHHAQVERLRTPDFGKAHSDPELLKKWEASHPGEPFPVWGDFTGIAGTKRDHKKPIKVVSLKERPAVASLGEGFTTGDTELYNNYYVLDTVIPLAEGSQVNEKCEPWKATVMWECPQGKSKVLGLTIEQPASNSPTARTIWFPMI